MSDVSFPAGRPCRALQLCGAAAGDVAGREATPPRYRRSLECVCSLRSPEDLTCEGTGKGLSGKCSRAEARGPLSSPCASAGTLRPPAALFFAEPRVHPQDAALSTCHSSDTRLDVCYVRGSAAPVASRDERRDMG